MPTDWTHATPPTLADFEVLAQAAWNTLPSEFRTMAGDVVIRIEDLASEDVLDELEIEDPFELTGLYSGVSLNRQGATPETREPDMVFLYRRAILDEWASSDEELGHLIAHVLIHEIGHHFGFSDEDMEEIEQQTSG